MTDDMTTRGERAFWKATAGPMNYAECVKAGVPAVHAALTPEDLATQAEKHGLAVVPCVEADNPENLRHTANWLQDTASLIAKDGPNGMALDFCEMVALNLGVVSGLLRARADAMLEAGRIKGGEDGWDEKRDQGTD